MSSLDFFWQNLFLISILARQLPRHQEIPNHLVGIQIRTRLPNRFLHFVLLSARPSISRTLHAVKNDLRGLLAAGVRIDFGVHAALVARAYLALLRVFLAAVNLGPGLGAVFHRNGCQTHVVLRATAIRNHWV